jgi:DhnA family fructose-bisphosphate aldolase class Ia
MKNRLNEFLQISNQPALVLDASAGLSLGTLAGLEDFSGAIHPLLALVSGLVCSPGQISKLGSLTKDNAGLLVRTDWNNTLRQSDFVLPRQSPQRIPILSADDALELGACGMVTSILLGYEEEVEAASILSMVQLALKGKTLGLPLVAEVLPTGPRVSLFGKAVELGASYALEGGADVIVVPHPGPDSLKTLGKFISVPWLVKPTSLQNASTELEAARSAGAAGLWLDHSLFALTDPQAYLAGLQAASSPLPPSGEGAGK